MKNRKRKSDRRYVMCLSNAGFKASLEIRKIYVALPEPESERRGLMRVIDESGDDYLFPSRLFAEVDLPTSAARVVNEAP